MKQVILIVVNHTLQPGVHKEIMATATCPRIIIFRPRDMQDCYRMAGLDCRDVLFSEGVAEDIQAFLRTRKRTYAYQADHE